MATTIQHRAAPRSGVFFTRGAGGIGDPPLWLTLLVCAVILSLRRIDALEVPQFWAEDGTVFFLQAHTLGARALLESYAGYLHAVPRLIAAAAGLANTRWIPTLYVAATFVVTLYVAARTQSSRISLGRNPALALAVVLVPDTFEVFFSLANLQWVLAGALGLLLVSGDARRWWQHAHDGLAAILLGLTGPFSIVLAPLFLARVWQRRTATSGVIAVLIGATALLQAWTIHRHPIKMRRDQIRPEALLAVPGMRIGNSLLAGGRIPNERSRVLETVLGIGTLLAVGGLALRKGAARPERIWLGLAFAGLLVVSLYRCRYVLSSLCHAGFGARYFFPLQLIVAWLLLGALADSRVWIARGAAIVAAWSVLINGARLREPALTEFDWTSYAAKIEMGEAVTVPINPVGWTFEVPARR